MSRGMSAGFERIEKTAHDRGLKGATLNVSFHTLMPGSELVFAAGDLGEEVGAVMEGACRVEAAGEAYRLSVGEVIVIPAAAPRRYLAEGAEAVVYRVVVQDATSATRTRDD